MQPATPLSWETLLNTLRGEYPELYRSWFEELPPGELVGGELRIVVDEPSRARYLRDSCSQAFVELVMSMTGRLIPVRFICEREGETRLPDSASQPLSQSPLNPDYTFEQFVVGPSNRLAHAACRAVCQQPGLLYNPLFVHGPSGVGKTHLLQAICAELRSPARPLQVAYVSCETFVNDFVRAIQAGQLPQFRDCARRADILVIDDIQFLADRESSQEELFHTFNALYQNRHQLVLSADSSPAEIPTLEDRLVSRFTWGLVAQMDMPTRETRHAILQKKARLRGCQIPDEVLDVVAERVESNVRTLEGALTKLILETQIDGKPMTPDTEREVLNNFDGAPQRLLQIADILEVVSEHFGVRVTELLGRKRSRSISYPRQVGMYLARRLTPLSLEEIGMHFGGRDHSTVLHAERVVETDRTRDKQLTDTLATLTRRLLGRR